MAKGFMPFDFLVDKGARFACEGNRVTVKREGDTLVVAHKRVPLLQVERLYDGAACRLRLFPTGDTTYHYPLVAVLRKLDVRAYATRAAASGPVRGRRGRGRRRSRPP